MKEQKNNNVEVIDANAVELETKITFAKPFEFNGQKYESIELNLDDLTGIDLEEAEVEFTTRNPQIAAQTFLKAMSSAYQAIVAAKAAGVNPQFIRSLPANEYAKVTATVQAFLLKRG